MHPHIFLCMENEIFCYPKCRYLVVREEEDVECIDPVFFLKYRICNISETKDLQRKNIIRGRIR